MTTTNDRTLCCSDTCEKRFECDISHINHIGTYYVEDYSSFGTATYADNDCVVEHWCGKFGDYKMFKPIEKNCSGCIYKNVDGSTTDISNCVCCSRMVDFAKNDYYRRK